CASWTSAPGYVTVDINRSGTTNDSINMMYVVAKGTCNLDADSGGQAGNQTSALSQMTICNGCLTPTTANDIILQDGGQYACTGTSLVAPASGGLFEAGWLKGYMGPSFKVHPIHTFVVSDRAAGHNCACSPVDNRSHPLLTLIPAFMPG